MGTIDFCRLLRTLFHLMLFDWMCLVSMGPIVRPSAVVGFDTFGLKLPVTLASTAAFDCIRMYCL